MFDIATNKWIEMPVMTEEKSEVSLCCVDNYLLYAIGGFNKANMTSPFSRTIEKLDLTTCDHWERLKVDLPFPIS